jgi:hypothetical protein
MRKTIIIIAALIVSCKKDVPQSTVTTDNAPIEEIELFGKWKINQVLVDGNEQIQQNESFIEFGAYQKYIGFDNKEYIYGIAKDSVIILDKNGDKVTSSQIIQESDDNISLVTKLPDGRVVQTSLVKE